MTAAVSTFYLKRAFLPKTGDAENSRDIVPSINTKYGWAVRCRSVEVFELLTTDSTKTGDEGLSKIRWDSKWATTETS
jgi:hypothetical protein